MMRRATNVFALLFYIFLCTPSIADDRQDAISAAKVIMKLLAKKDYGTLYDNQTSAWMKQQSPGKSSAITNMTFARANFSNLTSSDVYDVAYYDINPNWPLHAPIWSVTFLNVYPSLKVLERISVTKEDDGQFRMMGLDVAVAP